MENPKDPKDPKKPEPVPGALALPHVPSPVALATTRLEPTDFEQAWKIAHMFAEIRYCGVVTPAEALARIMYGANLGLSAMAALANVFTIPDANGAPKPALEASTMLGVCLQNPHICEYFRVVETTDERAVFVAKRVGGEEVRHTWTFQMAIRAGLVDRGGDDEKKKKNNWNRYPDAMLRARCITALARLVFPDLIRGFSSVEEMRDRDRDTIETTAEIVTPAVEAARAARDFPKEAEAIKARIIQALSKEDFEACREAIQQWDGGEPYASDFRKLYTDRIKAVKELKQPKPEEKKPEGAA